MPIPDNVYFGERPDGGGGISYGEVRLLISDQEKIAMLKSRIDAILINQIDELTIQGSKEGYIVWSPFPLVVLTCLAIETLGRIILDIEKIKDQNDYEISKLISTPIYQIIDSKLAHKPTKVFYQSFLKLHNLKSEKSIDKYSDILHRYLRNTFNHGYQAKGVYLSHKFDIMWEVDANEGFIILNPYLFWKRYKEVYEMIFIKITNGKDIVWRKNSLIYFETLLK